MQSLKYHSTWGLPWLWKRWAESPRVEKWIKEASLNFTDAWYKRKCSNVAERPGWIYGEAESRPRASICTRQLWAGSLTQDPLTTGFLIPARGPEALTLFDIWLFQFQAAPKEKKEKKVPACSPLDKKSKSMAQHSLLSLSPFSLRQHQRLLRSQAQNPEALHTVVQTRLDTSKTQAGGESWTTELNAEGRATAFCCST